MAWAVRVDLEQAWRADTLRDRPRAVAELVMGGEQMIEGRPRRVSFDDKHQGLGLIYATMTFLPESTAVYAVNADGVSPWREQTVGLIPVQVGGLIAPLVAPLSTTAESSRARPFTVGGSKRVWPIISVRGPLLDGARVELVNRWTLRLNRALLHSETALIDTRPDRRSMSVNGIPTNVLSPAGARISQASMSPGLQEVALRGSSVEGTAEATLTWREEKAADHGS